MVFNAECAAPACNPSRVAVLTGIRPSSSGVYWNASKWRAVLRATVTLPELFSAAGYDTYGIGKLSHHRDPSLWDRYAEIGGGLFTEGVHKVGRLEWGMLDVRERQMLDNRVARQGAAFLREEHDVPFFLACGFHRPHLAWAVPAAYFELYPLEQVELPPSRPDDLDDVPEAARAMSATEGDDHAAILAEEGAWGEAVRAYLASISFLDAQVGLLLDALDESPWGENTIICLWSDHGFHLGEKRHWRKFTLWEESARVPLVIAGPGVSAGRCARPAELVGLYATLAELAGLEVPPGVEGPSLVPLLRDPEAAWERPALTTYGPGNHTLRSERWRYIRYADGSEELYDHENDPNEWSNLASEPRFAGVRARLERWLPEVEARPVPLLAGKG